MKKFNALLDFIGANKKKELLKILIVNISLLALIVVVLIVFKQIMISLSGIGAMLVVNYLIFSSYTNKKRQILADRESEFITVISYFQFFISNSYNVYQAFQSLIPYTSPWMEEQIKSLILEIDNDKSVKPFVNFSNKFTTKVTNNVMLSIYQMVDEGGNGIHMLQFNALFQQLSRSHQKDLIDIKDRKMSSISTLPLIGAGAITVLITFGIISMMGEMINVL